MRLSRRTVNSLSTDHGEVELEFDPADVDDILVQRVGDKLVVAYLVHDSDPCNPMTDYDCQGTLYTRAPHSARDSTITDNDREVCSALGLSSGGYIDHDRDVAIGGVSASLWGHAARQVKPELDKAQWCELLLWVQRYDTRVDLTGGEVSLLTEYHCSDEGLAELKQKYHDALMDDLLDPRGYHEDLVYEKVKLLYREHWQEIVGPYVVPVSVSRGYERSYSATSWDGDVDDLPEGVWVADKGAMENITASACPDNVEVKQVTSHPHALYEVVEDGKVRMRGTHAECWCFVRVHHPVTVELLRQTAARYAQGVLDEYSKWCNGEAFGCVVQLYSLKGEDDDEPVWIPHADWESCWGFIGEDWAKQALRDEFFDPQVGHLQNEQLSLAHPLDSEGGLTD